MIHIKTQGSNNFKDLGANYFFEALKQNDTLDFLSSAYICPNSSEKTMNRKKGQTKPNDQFDRKKKNRTQSQKFKTGRFFVSFDLFFNFSFLYCLILEYVEDSWKGNTDNEMRMKNRALAAITSFWSGKIF